MTKHKLLNIYLMVLVAIAIAGCDNDDDRLKAEEASLDELHQEFENVCSVRMVFETYPSNTDFSPYAALESDQNGLFSVYVKNESNTTIMVVRDDYFSAHKNREYYDFPVYLLNFLGIYNEDGSYKMSLLSYGDVQRYSKQEALAPGEEILYFRNEQTDFYVGESWGISPGRYDVKLQFPLTVKVYDNVYDTTDDGHFLVNDIEPVYTEDFMVDMTMRMVCLPAPERKPVETE